MDYQTNSGTSPESNGAGSGGIPTKTSSRPRRPCDACRKRKSRCEMTEGESVCTLCRFHHQPCLFNENPQPRKKRKISATGANETATSSGSRDPSFSGNLPALDQSADGSVVYVGPEQRTSISNIRQDTLVEDYANLKGPSLLKKTLGLQSHRHSRVLGPTSEFEPAILALPSLAPSREELSLGHTSLRKVTSRECFLLLPDSATSSHGDEMHDLDTIESLVAPHGQQLIHLYFRIVHPSFPILHKKVFLEKYARTHREFSPPLLAAVYILALNWWSYSVELSLLVKPDVEKLEFLALKTMVYIVSRPKLSTIQAGLLLLQRPEGDSWSLTGKLVALGQDLGLHLDCSRWRIPVWEKGLRKRLGWALFMQDKWGSLVHGRPSHITSEDWMAKPVTEADFPERAADEDDEEGSTEVEKGRVLFCEMIKLTEILTTILSEFYTLRAEEDFRQRELEGGLWVLEKAKPIQIRLKDWSTQLPDCLRMENLKMRKLNSTGYLHLAYYTAEITLHRRIIRSMSHETNTSLINICRSAAQARLTSVTDFVKSLRPEHLQSFWYSASKYCFAVVGTFISLLWVTASTKEDAEKYKEKLEEYRWTLRLSSKSAEFLDRAISMISTSTGALVKAIPEKRLSLNDDEEEEEEDDYDEVDGDNEMQAQKEEQSIHDVDGADGWSVSHTGTDGMSIQSPTQYSECHLDLMWQGFGVPEGSYDVHQPFQQNMVAAEEVINAFLDVEEGFKMYREPGTLNAASQF